MPVDRIEPSAVLTEPNRSMQRISVILAVCTLWGCSRDSTVSTPATTPTPTDNVTASDVVSRFGRSCGPCHRREGGDAKAIARGVYLDTELDIRRAMNAYALGRSSWGLNTLLGRLERDGELRVGPQGIETKEGTMPMPPTGSGYPPLTREDARAIKAWVRTF